MSLGSAVVTSCLQLFWPARCAGCDVALASDNPVLCGGCAQATLPIGNSCAGCALPHFGPPARHRCPGCARFDFAFSRAYAAFEYGGPLADAIVRMKHGDRPDLARRLGRLLAEPLARALAPASGPPVDAILPVPLHPRKLRRRGFNQALELAVVALSRRPAPALLAAPRIERTLLQRVRDTRELGRGGPNARRVALFGAFAVADPARVRGRRFVLVDDVMTTGATFNECAEVLVRAGAEEVRVVALTRTLR
ncbi:MAG TPA: ComF family protein [Polyangia bacterium]|jgi:ComF family protein